MSMRFYTRGAWLLAEYVKKEGLLEQELAPNLQVSPQQISNYLNGKCRPSLDKALLIERLCGVPVQAWGEARRMSRSMAQRYAPSASASAQ